MQSQGLELPPEPLVGPSGPRVSINGSCVDPSGNDPETGDSERCGTVFGVFNPDFPLYIKHENLSEITHGGQCLCISVLQLWILHMAETSMRVENSDIYGFLEPQSIKRSGQSQFETESYIKSWMQSSKRNVYLGAYMNGGHWQMVVIVPNEHLVVWFCSLHNRPDNFLKGITNSALKGLDDAPQPKSKPPARWIVVKCNRQKGSTECGYYVMH
ncbi:hypothetical protein GmHk_16G046344 [Glycine max]|nr:hypothetical protein GmHk_16G046344 [Glycine max]